MSGGNGEEVANSRHACASCKHQRKKCESNCIFAPHFPVKKSEIFKEVHKTFGVKNVSTLLENLSPGEEREKAVESLEWEALAWKNDPVEGPLGVYKKQKKELELLLKNQRNISDNNRNTATSFPYPYNNNNPYLCGFQHNSGPNSGNHVGVAPPSTSSNMIDNATSFAYGNTNNFHNPSLALEEGAAMNNCSTNIAGSVMLQRSGDNDIETQEQDHQGYQDYVPIDPSYYQFPLPISTHHHHHQGQVGRSSVISHGTVISHGRGLFVVPYQQGRASTAILPKPENDLMQRNTPTTPLILPGSSSMRPQPPIAHYSQRGSQGRNIVPYLDGSASGNSQGRGLH